MVIETKHKRLLYVYRLKGAVYAEFDTGAEANAFLSWFPMQPDTVFTLVRSEELRGLDHVNAKPERWKERYAAYIDGMCEAYKAAPADTVQIPNTMEVPPPIVGINRVKHPATGGQLTDVQYTNYLLELILQAIKEK